MGAVWGHVLLVLLLSSCGHAEVGVTADAIIDGENDTEYGAVVAVLNSAGLRSSAAGVSTVCTGTLISPSHVLTAAHCAHHDEIRVGDEVIRWETPFGGGLTPYLVGDGDHIREVTYCRVHPALRRAGDTSPEPDGDCENRDGDAFLGPYDVAVLVLESPIPLPWSGRGAARSFHRLLDEGEAPALGDRVLHVGYGLNVTRDTLASVPGHIASVGRRRSAARTLVGLSAADDLAEVITGTTGTGSGSSGGDSGGPILWTDAPARALWGPPPIAVHSWAPTGQAGQVGTYLGTPSTRAFLRHALDRNGDGRFDYDCRDGWRHGMHPLASPDNDRDGDGYLDVEDIAPDDYNPCQEDNDGDGVWDNYHDNCTGVANPGQEDRDGDGLGDACDRCPDDVATGHDSDREPGLDLDGGGRSDGVPDECDICPFVYDPDQANCNLDAELVVRAREAAMGVPPSEQTPLRGDACDPTPCGETALGMQITRFGADAELTTGTIRVDALTDWTDVPRATSRRVAAREGFRFCRCPGASLGGDREGTREECARPVASDVDPSIQLGGCVISDVPQYELATEDLLTWRWMTIPSGAYVRSREAGLPVPSGLRAELPATHEARAPDALHDTDLRFEWGHGVEVLRWAEVFPGDPPPAASAGLEGVLWTHTARAARGAPATWDRELSSHYWSGGIPLPFRAAGRVPVCGAPIMPLPSSSTICPFCAGMITFPFAVGFRPCPFPEQFGVAFGDWTVLPEELAPNLPFSRDDMAPLLGWDGRWIAAAEPPSVLPERGLRFVGLAADLGAIGRVVVETDAGFRDLLASCPVPGQCGVPLAAASRTALAGELAPPPRTDFVATLSATRDTLYVFGGALAGGAPARDAWAFEVGRREWRRLDAASDALGRVLAATFDASTGDALVLDEITRVVGRRTERRARLVRVAGQGEGVEVVASWPRLTPHDRFALAAGNDGSLYVTGSGALGHVVLRLAAARFGTFRVAGVALGLGRVIPEQVRANRHALTVMVEHGRGFRARTYEERDFLRLPLAAERCF